MGPTPAGTPSTDAPASTKADPDAIASRFAELAAEWQPPVRGMATLLALLRPTIVELRARGASLPDICRLLGAAGHRVSSDTLGRYLAQVGAKEPGAAGGAGPGTQPAKTQRGTRGQPRRKTAHRAGHLPGSGQPDGVAAKIAKDNGGSAKQSEQLSAPPSADGPRSTGPQASAGEGNPGTPGSTPTASASNLADSREIRPTPDDGADTGRDVIDASPDEPASQTYYLTRPPREPVAQAAGGHGEGDTQTDPASKPESRPEGSSGQAAPTTVQIGAPDARPPTQDERTSAAREPQTPQPSAVPTDAPPNLATVEPPRRRDHPPGKQPPGERRKEQAQQTGGKASENHRREPKDDGVEASASDLAGQGRLL